MNLAKAAALAAPAPAGWSPPVGVALGRLSVPAFHACGYAGLVAGVALGVTVCARHGFSAAFFLATVVAAAATFLGLALAVKVVSGAERLVYYHHEIAVFVVTALVATSARQPVLRHLELIALFVGTFLACGRVGCFMVGCCHGRPSRRGVVYGDAHVEAGFPARLARTPLFPVQLVEAVAVAAIVVAGTALVDPAAPGRALVWYVTAYGCLRFVLEPFRGDADVRPHFVGVSEAQWISVASAVCVATLSRAGVLPDLGGAMPAAFALATAAGLRVLHVALRRVPTPDPSWTVTR